MNLLGQRGTQQARKPATSCTGGNVKQGNGKQLKRSRKGSCSKPVVPQPDDEQSTFENTKYV